MITATTIIIIIAIFFLVLFLVFVGCRRVSKSRRQNSSGSRFSGSGSAYGANKDSSDNASGLLAGLFDSDGSSSKSNHSGGSSCGGGSFCGGGSSCGGGD